MTPGLLAEWSCRLQRVGKAAGKGGMWQGFAHLNSFKLHFILAVLTLEGASESPERLVKTKESWAPSQSFHSLEAKWPKNLHF